MTTLRVEVKQEGPLFEDDVQAKVTAAINEGLEEMALMGEAKVKSQLYRGHGLVTGHLRRSIAGGLVRDLNAQVDAGEHVQGRNVVYASWVEGVSPRNNRSRFKGYRMFRNAFNFLRRLNTKKIIGARVVKALGG